MHSSSQKVMGNTRNSVKQILLYITKQLINAITYLFVDPLPVIQYDSCPIIGVISCKLPSLFSQIIEADIYKTQSSSITYFPKSLQTTLLGPEKGYTVVNLWIV